MNMAVHANEHCRQWQHCLPLYMKQWQDDLSWVYIIRWELQRKRPGGAYNLHKDPCPIHHLLELSTKVTHAGMQ